MRVFALSDIHVDYEANMKWVQGLSRADHQDDLLILAGDVSHRQALLGQCLEALARRFHKVLFLPGNHDLWVLGEAPGKTSFQKFMEVAATVRDSGACMEAQRFGDVLVQPLLGWYDYSFGEPGEELRSSWMDFRACRWPQGYEAADVALHFERLNRAAPLQGVSRVITFSHFLPRLDLVPGFVPRRHRILDPVLGSTRLEAQLRRLQPDIHVYGHSHINRSVSIDGVRYVNNAFGYPQESAIAARQLLCIDDL